LPFLDGKDGAGLHSDIAHDASAAGVILQLHIIGSRRDAGDPQAFVVVDCSVAIMLALIGTPPVLARWRYAKARDRMQCKILKSDAFAFLRHRTTAVCEGN